MPIREGLIILVLDFSGIFDYENQDDDEEEKTLATDNRL